MKKRRHKHTRRAGSKPANASVVTLASLPSRSIAMSAPITFAAADAGADGGEAAMSRLSVVAYTGVAMALAGWWSPVVIDLTGLRVGAASRPLLRQHDPLRVVGHTTDIRVEGVDRVVLDAVISGTAADAAEIRSTGLRGFPWQASVGASVERVEFVKSGATASANGRTFSGPIYIARSALLREVSIVALGADDSTTARVAASDQETNMNFSQWLANLGFDESKMSADQRIALQASFDALHGETSEEGDADPRLEADGGADNSTTAPNQADDVIAQIRRDTSAEVQRIASIRAASADHPTILAQAIAEGWTTERTELNVLRASRPVAPGAIVSGTATTSNAIEASMLMALGVDQAQVGQWYDQPTMNAAVDRRLRNFGLHELCSFVAASAGVQMPAGKFGDDHIRAAFRADQMLIQAQQFSTVSLSGILGNVANRVLLRAFLSVQKIAELLSDVVSVSDFKAFTSHRLTSSGRFEEVAADGEIKLGQLTVSDYPNQLKTRGRMIALTRQAMINDDLGSLTDIVKHLGRGGALAIERAWHTLVLSNPGPFFDAANANYIEGAGTAFNISGLTQLEQTFLNQVDAAGEPVMAMPKYLLVPTSLSVPAQQIYAETRVNETTTANAGKPANNPHAGKWIPIASPWLNAQALPGSSALAYYLFADPDDVAAVQIAFLNGRRTPVVESAQTSFETLGMQFRAYFDFGIAMQDPRGAAKSKGEA